MKKEMNPLMLIGAAVVVVAILVFVMMKVLAGPEPIPAAAKPGPPASGASSGNTATGGTSTVGGAIQKPAAGTQAEQYAKQYRPDLYGGKKQ